MKTPILLILVIVVPTSTLAQFTSDLQPPRSWGYVFAGVHRQISPSFAGSSRMRTQISRAGFGWEWLTLKDLAIGLEGAGTSELAESAVNVSYHFRNIPKLGPKFVPFVTGGGTLDWAFDGGFYGNLRYNVGAGTSVWLHPHIGPRIEVRRYGPYRGNSDTELRVGLTFRF